MPKILILHDPSGICKKEKIDLRVGTNLLDFIINKYGDHGFYTPTEIYKDRYHADNLIKSSECSFDKININLRDGDFYIIVHRPQGGNPLDSLKTGLGSLLFDPTGTFFATSIAYGGLQLQTQLIQSLFPTPDSPETPRQSDTDNNAVSAQSNKIRLLDRIPDNYGNMRVYPDLIAQPYSFFQANDLFLVEFFCIGRGSYDISEIKSAETLISDITGSTATIYQPNTRPSTVLNVRTSNAVDGQILHGTNENFVDLDNIDVTFDDLNSFYSLDDGFNSFFDLSNGDNFTMTGATDDGDIVVGSSDMSFSGNDITGATNAFLNLIPIGSQITITGSVSNNITTIVTAKPDNQTLTVSASLTTESNTSATVTQNINNDGSWTFNNVVRTVEAPSPLVYRYTVDVSENLHYTASGQLINVTSIVSDLNKINEAGFFNIPLDVDEVWIDLQFLRGLISKDEGTVRVDFDITLERVSNSSTELTQVNVIAQTRSSYSETFIIIPNFPGEEYRCKIARTSDSEDGDSDESQWTRLAGVKYITVPDFGDITTLLVETKKTTQATRSQERKINMIAERKLGTWTRSGTTFTAPTATSRMADAIVNILTDPFSGNKSITEIDLVSLYDIQDSLDNDPIYGDKLGRFCYSFGDRTVSAYSEALTCANTCRVVMYREGSQIRFKRDELKPFISTLFNTRNKKPDSETKTINVFKKNDFDGIELEFLKENGESGIIFFPENQSAAYPNKINAAGTRNYEQAWNRANYEFRRLKFKRSSIGTTVTSEGLLVELTDRISNAEGTAIESQNGEIKSFSGLTILTNDKIIINDSNENYVILRNEDGTVSEQIEITSIVDDEYGFILDSLPDFALYIRGYKDYQVGILYNILVFNSKNVQEYSIDLIQPQSDGYVKLQMSNYDSRIYLPDTTTPTAE
jgi:hypothetical protein